MCVVATCSPVSLYHWSNTIGVSKGASEIKAWESTHSSLDAKVQNE